MLFNLKVGQWNQTHANIHFVIGVFSIFVYTYI